ncbi:MAG: zinc ABC transporter solute-binding protein [Proteobacteria bacterium]|nr:zinc ABC transporter solute-binding protein [Pseudomonadota bacterium]
MSPKKFKTLFPALALPVILWSGTLQAEVPRVVADIAPVHSLVSMVMKGVGEPKLLVPQNVSPHHYAMRPSEAKALQEANLVVYVGHDMSPWMEPLFETVAASADALNLSEVDGVLALPYREGPVFGDDVNHEGYDHEEEGHDEHGEEDHDDHEGHDHEEEGHDEHGEEDHDDHAHHDHDGNDPHMWLDPENAKIWLDAIASELGYIDPENADRYSVNAKSAKQQITREMHHIEEHLVAVQDKDFLVFHDAFQYFEKRFGIAATGSISLSDASKPSASRLRELKHLFEEQAINCVLSEPQFSSKLVDNVFGGYKPHIGVVDPIGIDLKLGPALYPALLENIALGIAECVNP